MRPFRLPALVLTTALLAIAGLPPTATAATAATAVGAAPPAGHITTLAGTIGDGPALNVAQRVHAMVGRGTAVYMASESKYVVRAFDTTTGRQQIVAGNGNQGSPSDTAVEGVPATSTSVGYVSALAVDDAGNLYLADASHDVIRKVDTAGIITTVAGNGEEGYGGDGGPARAASFGHISGLSVDPLDNIFVADSGNHRVRKIDPLGAVSTFAGTGNPNYTAAEIEGGNNGFGGPATSADVTPWGGVVADGAGSLYIGSYMRILKVDPLGVIQSVAGGGGSFYPDTQPAATARITPSDIQFDTSGNLYFSEPSSLGRIRKLDPSGTITTIAGTGAYAFAGDGGPARQASFKSPGPLAMDAAGSLYVSDVNDYRVRKIDRPGNLGTISTVAGTGSYSFSGDGGPAPLAQFHRAHDVAVDAAGNVFVADWGSHRIRRIARNGVITTVVGNGADGPNGYGSFGGDGGPATAASLRYPVGIAFDATGNLYIADSYNWRVRKVDTAGIITTIAGTGVKGFSGDGGPATSAMLGDLTAVTVDLAGNVYVSEGWDHRVRRIDPAGVITTVAGNGTRALSGDGGPAPEAALNYPRGLATDVHGNLYIADFYNGRVRKVDTSGVITSVAERVIGQVADVAVDPAGNLLVAGSATVRRIDAGGRATTVAGTGAYGFSGDGGPATSARINPVAVAVDGANLQIVDQTSDRVRTVGGGGESVPPSGRSWGWNAISQLGDGGTVDRSTPVAATGLTDVTAVAGGGYHSLALRGDGTVWAWGWNGLGQLGDDTAVDRRQAVRVPDLTSVVAIAAGAYHSLAVRSDGSVWAWGWNGVGQLGDGTTVQRNRPVQVAGVSATTTPTGIAAGGLHSLAIGRDGSVRAWGWNALGQLGDGTTVDRHSPVAVPGLASMAGVAAGAYHSLAVHREGTVKAWGWNGAGQLGDGSTTNRSLPVTVQGIGGAASAVAAGAYHSLAVGSDGSAWAWGWNALGQLGDGTTLDRARAGRVSGLGTVTQVVGGGYHSLALVADGTARSWGWNGVGQLGNGSTTDALVPVAVRNLTGGRGLAAGAGHTLAAASP